MKYDQIMKLEDEATVLYDKYSKSMGDIDKIAANLNIDREVVAQVHSHMFVDEHLVKQGLNPSETCLSKFDPSIDQARAWTRLIDGTFVRSDLRLFLHEYLESSIMLAYMKNTGRPLEYTIAHKLANCIHNWQDFVN